MLKSRLGVSLYRLLPNHWSWRLLSASERDAIIRNDLAHNTERPDYSDPSLYQGGQNFDADDDRLATARGRQIAAFLDRTQPRHVIEVGPGAGYYTRLIVSHPAVKEYTAVDLNPAFLEFLKPRLAALPVTANFVHGTTASLTTRADATLLISTVHHVPDRVALFQDLGRCLAAGGAVLAIDPAHYVWQWRKILRKSLIPGYLANLVRTGVSTHNMCSLSEYRYEARHTGFTLRWVEFSNHPRRVQRLRQSGIPLGPFWRWTSQEIAVELRAPAPPAA